MNLKILAFSTVLLFFCTYTSAAVSSENRIVVNVKDFGAKGDGISDDSDAIQNALNTLLDKELIYQTPPYHPVRAIIVLPEGAYKITKTLRIFGNTCIEGGGVINYELSNGGAAFIFGDDVGTSNSNLSIKNLTITSSSKESVFLSVGPGKIVDGKKFLPTNIFLENLQVKGFGIAAKFENARKVTINHCTFVGNCGIEFSGSSAEVNITNSFFTNIHEGHLENTPEISYGIKCINVDGNTPEGLTVSNTLFFRYRKALVLHDLYLGKFISCYFDGKGDACEPILYQPIIRVIGISFTDCWFLRRGLLLKNNYSQRDDITLRISGCNFENTDGIAIQIGEARDLPTNYRNIFIHNCSFKSNRNSKNINDTFIGIVALGSIVRNVILNNLYFENYNSCLQFVDTKAPGENHENIKIFNTTRRTQLTSGMPLNEGIYSNYPVMNEFMTGN